METPDGQKFVVVHEGDILCRLWYPVTKPENSFVPLSARVIICYTQVLLSGFLPFAYCYYRLAMNLVQFGANDGVSAILEAGWFYSFA